MATATPQIRNDLIPMKSGIVTLTLLDNNFRPLFAKSYSTARPFLTSTQYTTSRTNETLPNGNGDDKDFPTGEQRNLAIVTQTYDPKFHSILSGSEIVENAIPTRWDTTITPDDNGTYVFSDNALAPVASLEDNKIHFEIRDSYGNPLTESTEETLDVDTYKYDADTKTLTFDTSLAHLDLSCVYYILPDNHETYQASSILRNPVFMVETFGEMRSASTEETIYCYQKMPRASVSGDLPGITTQKSISATITYNLKSAPVPQGMSPFIQQFFTK